MRSRVIALLAVAFLVALLVGLRSHAGSPPSSGATAPKEPIAQSTPTHTQEPDLSAQTRETAAPPPTPVAMTSIVARLRTRAEAQYESARSILADVPSTRLAAAQLVNGDQGPAGQFYTRDRQLQADIKCVGKVEGNALRACMNLAEAEEFEYEAVSDAVGGCNAHDAELNLHVARAFLDEVARDMRGTEQHSWNPPDITGQENGHVLCTD